MRWFWFRKKKYPAFPRAGSLRVRLRCEGLEGRTLPTVISPVFAEVQANAGRAHVATLSTPSAGVDENGNFDVAFVENVSPSQSQIVLRRFQADGTPQTNNATQVVAGPAPTGTINQPKIAVRRDGSLVVAYIAPSASGTFTTVFAQRFSSDGGRNGAAILAPTTDQDQRNQIEPSVSVLDATGAFYVSWTDQATATNGDIRARGFDANGAALNPTDVAIAATAANEHESSLTVQPNTVVVSFTRDGAGSTQNVFARRFDVNLAGQGAEFQVNTSAGAASQSGAALDAALNFVVVWTDSTNPGSTAIKMRRFNATGVAQTGAEEVVDAASGSKVLPRVAKAGDSGRYVVAYVDTSSGTGSISYAEFNTAGILQVAKHNFTNHSSMQAAAAIGASHNAIFAIAANDNFTGQDEPWARTFKPMPSSFFAIGAAPGRVQIRKVGDGSLLADFQPYGAGYTGAVTVAWGDVNGDGIPDLVLGAATGNPDVRVYDGKTFANNTFNAANPDASRLAIFFPYALQFNVGANVAVGDVTGTGYADIVTGATVGNPDVRVFRGKDIATQTFSPTGSSRLAQWFPYGLQFNVGANVAVGDLNRDGFADIITGATTGNPDVRVFSGQDIAQARFNPNGSSLLTQFFAYGLQFNVGAFVAVGDVNGDGNPDLITGASTGNPHVKVYDGAAFTNGKFDRTRPDDSLLSFFFAYDVQFNVGVTVAAADIEKNGKFDIITGASVNNPHYRVVKGTATGSKPPAVTGIEGIPNDLQGGVFVGGL